MSFVPRVLNKRDAGVPDGAILVDRSTKYGNPFRIGPDGGRAEVIQSYRSTIFDRLTFREILDLRGHDLVCWCAPEPCHADVLLEMANRECTCGRLDRGWTCRCACDVCGGRSLKWKSVGSYLDKDLICRTCGHTQDIWDC